MKYIYIYPKASQFRKRGCEHYNLLGLIFNKSIATKVLHHASTKDLPDVDDDIELENQLLHSNTLMDLDVNSTSYSDPIHTFDGSTSHDRKRTTISVERRIRKENRSQQIGDAL